MSAKLDLGLCVAACFCLLAAAGASEAQTVIYVDRDASGPAYDGTTWCTAFVELQDALDVATANTVIRVANGVYRPDATGLADPREATFALLDGVQIVGGYAGCDAPNPDERNLASHETILSGDLLGNDAYVALLEKFAACYTGGGAAITPACEAFNFNSDAAVDGSDFISLLSLVLYSDNAYHVVTSFGNTASASLDGCTISSGNATGSGAHQNGGGMYVVVSAPSLTACTFRYNAAVNGGGLYNGLSGQVGLSDCTFRSNFAYAGTNGGFGGGASNMNGQPAFRRCVFIGNGAGNGGGVFTQNSSSVVHQSRFAGNLAAFGAGLYTVYGYPTVSDTIFSGNLAVVKGGGIRVWGGGPRFTNVSLSQNDASMGGGISSLDATTTIDNGILWGNTDDNGTIESSQLQVSSGSTTVRFTCLRGLSAFAGNDNIDTDPMFFNPLGLDAIVGTDDDDLHLRAGSPCLDTGHNEAISTTTDLDGNPRIRDGDGDGTETVDMGAYELEYVAPPEYFASRDLSGFASPIQPFTVAITVNPPAGTTAWAVEEAAPPGWIAVSEIDNGGTWDSINEKVKWGPFFSDQAATLRYTVTPPVPFTGGALCFSGVVSIDGTNQTVAGALCLEVTVPAISTWGLFCVALSLLITGTLLLRRRNASIALRCNDLTRNNCLAPIEDVVVLPGNPTLPKYESLFKRMESGRDGIKTPSRRRCE